MNSSFTFGADSVFAVTCSPTDPDVVATGGGDDKTYIWRIRDSAPPLELKGAIFVLTTCQLKVFPLYAINLINVVMIQNSEAISLLCRPFRFCCFLGF